MWEYYNPNPVGRIVGDCAVRAISKALDMDWETAFVTLCKSAYLMGDLPNSNAVWGAVLRQHGFYRESVPNTCPDCYTAGDFANDHQDGTYVLGFGNHVTTVKNGVLYDAWDSSQEIPQYYWFRKDD